MGKLKFNERISKDFTLEDLKTRLQLVFCGIASANKINFPVEYDT